MPTGSTTGASERGGKLRGIGSSSTASITTSKQVRQVPLYHVATPREETSNPVLCDLQSEGGDSWIYDDNYKVNVVSFALHGESYEEQTNECFADRSFPWYSGLPTRRYVMEEHDAEKPTVFHVNMVRTNEEKMLTVLDSGADDISLLPRTMADRGTSQVKNSARRCTRFPLGHVWKKTGSDRM